MERIHCVAAAEKTCVHAAQCSMYSSVPDLWALVVGVGEPPTPTVHDEESRAHKSRTGLYGGYCTQVFSRGCGPEVEGEGDGVILQTHVRSIINLASSATVSVPSSPLKVHLAP